MDNCCSNLCLINPHYLILSPLGIKNCIEYFSEYQYQVCPAERLSKVMLKISKSSACDQSMVVTHISQSVSFSLKALVKSNHPLPCEPSNPYPFLGLLSPPLPCLHQGPCCWGLNHHYTCEDGHDKKMRGRGKREDVDEKAHKRWKRG